MLCLVRKGEFCNGTHLTYFRHLLYHEMNHVLGNVSVELAHMPNFLKEKQSRFVCHILKEGLFHSCHVLPVK